MLNGPGLVATFQRFFRPFASLDVVSTNQPELTHPRHHPQHRTRSAGIIFQPLESCTDVVVITCEQLKPMYLMPSQQFGFSTLGESGVKFSVLLLLRIRFSRFIKLLSTVF